MTATPVIPAVIRKREREVVDDFRRGGATDPTSAKSLADLGLEDSWPVRRLQKRAVIREPQPGVMYLDEEVWAAVRRTRRQVVLTFMAVVVVIVIAVWIVFVTFT